MEAHSSRPLISDAIPADELDQVSDEQFWGYARRLARQEPSLIPAHEYLECHLHHNRCFIPLNLLHEVCLASRQYAFLPGMPWWVQGLANWRGEAIVVINLHAYLTRQAIHGVSPEGMLLVARSESVPLAFYVCAVGHTVALEHVTAEEAEQQADAWIAPSRKTLVKGVQADAVILDMQALLASVISHIGTTPHDG